MDRPTAIPLREWDRPAGVIFPGDSTSRPHFGFYILPSVFFLLVLSGPERVIGPGHRRFVFLEIGIVKIVNRPRAQGR